MNVQLVSVLICWAQHHTADVNSTRSLTDIISTRFVSNYGLIKCGNCNRSLPSSLVPVSQNESKCKAFYNGNYKTRMSRKFS